MPAVQDADGKCNACTASFVRAANAQSMLLTSDLQLLRRRRLKVATKSIGLPQPASVQPATMLQKIRATCSLHNVLKLLHEQNLQGFIFSANQFQDSKNY